MAEDIDHADPGFQADGKKRYPLDTERHIRAAWAFVHMASNTAPYTAGELQQIRDRIVAAWKDKIDPAGPPAATGPASNAIANQASLDHVHDCLKAMTDGDCCKPSAAGRHGRVLLGHLKEAHDALCRAGAKCEGFVPEAHEAGAEGDTDKAARGGDLMKAFASEILPRLDALAKRVAELEATPLPPQTMARATASLTKREDSAYPGASPDDVVATLARMSDEDRTLTLIKAAHADPIRPFGSRPRA
jgi:hypothetical protein